MFRHLLVEIGPPGGRHHRQHLSFELLRLGLLGVAAARLGGLGPKVDLGQVFRCQGAGRLLCTRIRVKLGRGQVA